jgi:hypothetical protein
LDIDTYNSTIHHNAIWNITGGKDSFYLVASTTRGYHRVFNNTFLGPVFTDSSVEARNNIFAASQRIDAAQQSNNLFMETDPKFNNASASDFTLQPDSPAVDMGIPIPGITEGFVGNAPDIRAYERGAAIWKAGSNLTTPSN